jgi:hypothetical protein
MDLGIGKRVGPTERTNLQFRAEFFNIFNHPQYGLPQARFDITNSGTVIPGFGSITQTVNTTTPVSPVDSGTPRDTSLRWKVAF